MRNSIPILLAICSVVVGCAGRALVRNQYVLSPAPAAETASAAATEAPQILIDVGPVYVPAYLRRPQIVTRVAENRLKTSEIHTWAEDLGDSLSQVVVQNLAVMVPSARVSELSITSPADRGYGVAIRLDRYERDETVGAVVLSASWTVTAGAADDVVAARRVVLRERLEGDSYAEVVAAMSRASATLSREIADVIRADAAGGKRR